MRAPDCPDSLAVFSLTLIKRPYKTIEDQLLAVTSQLMLLLIFTGAGHVKAFEDTRIGAAAFSDASLAERVYVFGSARRRWRPSCSSSPRSSL